MLLGRTMDRDHIDKQGYYSGADCALWWALGRGGCRYTRARRTPPKWTTLRRLTPSAAIAGISEAFTHRRTPASTVESPAQRMF